jgi:hypothetical protein
VYPKFSGLISWSENCKWYSSLQLHCYFMSQSGEFYRHNPLCCFSTSVYCCKHIFRYDSVRKLLDTPSYVTESPPPLIPKAAIGNDPELVQSTSILSIHLRFMLTYPPISSVFEDAPFREVLNYNSVIIPLATCPPHHSRIDYSTLTVYKMRTSSWSNILNWFSYITLLRYKYLPDHLEFCVLWNEQTAFHIRTK